MLRSVVKSSAFIGIAMCISASASAYTISFDHGVDSDGVATTNVDGVNVLDFNSPEKCGGYTGCFGNYTYHTGSKATEYNAPELSQGSNTTRYFADPNNLSGDNKANFYIPDTANYFGLLWGSIDPANSVTFYNGNDGTDNPVASITGTDIENAASEQNISLADQNGSAYVNLLNLPAFNTIVFNSEGTAFESDNQAYGTVDNTPDDVPEPGSLGILALGLVGLGALARRRRMI